MLAKRWVLMVKRNVPPLSWHFVKAWKSLDAGLLPLRRGGSIQVALDALDAVPVV